MSHRADQWVFVPGRASTDLRSVEYTKLIDVLCEGEIEGLVNGAQSIYLNGTPVKNPDTIRDDVVIEGTYNFENVSFNFNNGTQTQEYLPGFPASEAENTYDPPEVTAAAFRVITITEPDLTGVRLNMRIPRLTNTNSSNGNVGGTTVRYTVELESASGGYVLQPVGVSFVSLSPLTATTATTTVACSGIEGAASWTKPVITVEDDDGSLENDETTVSYDIEYQADGATSWTLLRHIELTGEANGRTTTGAGGVFHLINMPEDIYHIRITNISGGGSVRFRYLYEHLKGTTVAIAGKSPSAYTRSHLIDLTQEGMNSPPWNIKVTRLTEDSTSDFLQNKTFIDSYTEIIDQKLSYPNSAVVGVEIDSTAFSGVPNRGYDVKLLKVKIPSNYDPLTKLYTGLWDGTFKEDKAWTDNPAWCFYDLATNPRYGLGKYIDESLVDKTTLYTIGQYCDEFVSSGDGHREHRFTCNLYLQTRQEAYKTLSNFASIFRGMLYWSNNQLVTLQDSPTSVTAQFTNADVIEGQFIYEGTAAKTRHTVALVTWNDPENAYKQSIEYVEDSSAVALRGIHETEVVAIGCTSRGQAYRVGKWLLYVERYETETVSFQTGLEGTQVAPGEIIKTSDQHRVGARHGGRITAVTDSTLTLDSPLVIGNSETYTLTNVLSDGTLVDSTITNPAGTYTVVDITPSFTTQPPPNSLWVVASNVVSPEEWRVISITEESKNIYNISALKYNSSKYDFVENGIELEERQASLITTSQDHVTNLVTEDSLYLINPTTLGARLEVSWDRPVRAVRYLVEYTLGDNNTYSEATIQSNYEILGVPVGAYSVTITAYNSVGTASIPITISGTTLGVTVTPSDISNFTIVLNGLTSFLNWDAVTDENLAYYQIRFSPDVVGATWQSSSLLVERISRDTTTATVPTLLGTYFIKTVSISGTYNLTATSLVNTTSPSASDPSIAGWNLIETFSEDPNFDGLVNGSRAYALGSNTSTIYQYDLATPKDLSTSVAFVTGDSFSVLSQSSSSQALKFNTMGTRAFVLDNAGDVYQYDLDTAWDISSASYTGGQTYAISEENTPTAMDFSPDGLRMFICGNTDNTVYMYDLATAWDISSGVTYTTGDLKLVSTEDIEPTGISFNPDGTQMFMLGGTTNEIFMYDLSTAWDLTTAIYSSDSYVVTTEDGIPTDIDFMPDGLTMYITGDSTNTVYMYELTTPWDISTGVTFTGGDILDISSEETSPLAMVLSRPYVKIDGSTLKLSNPDIINSGTYNFFNTVDIGSVYRSQFIIDVDVGAETLSNFMADWATLDAVTILNGTVVDPTLAGVDLEARTTDDDPTLTPTWSDWEPFVVGDYNSRAFEFRATLTTADPNITAFITGLDIFLSMLDRILSDNDVISAAGDKYNVSSEMTTPADIFFRPDGSTMYVLDSSGDDVYQYTLATPWEVTSASYASLTKDVGTEDNIANGLTFSFDGSRMYICGFQNATVYQYNLSTSWNVSTAAYTSSYSVTSEDNNPTSLAFSPDGSKMFVLGNQNDTVFMYSLTTSWEIATGVTYSGEYHSVTSEETNPQAIAFRIDGVKMYISGSQNDTVYEYDVPTAWDLTSVTYDSADQGFIGLQEFFPQGIALNYEGTRMYATGGTRDTIYGYDLTTPWKANTLSYNGLQNTSPQLGGEDILPEGFAFSSDGDKLFVVGRQNDRVYMYDLTTPWFISSASYSTDFISVAPELDPMAITFNADGTNMWVLGRDDDTIRQYDLSPGWDITTASLTATVYAISESFPTGLSFNSDGTRVYISGASNDRVVQYDLSPAWDVSTATSGGIFSILPETGDNYGLTFSTDGSYMFVTGQSESTIYRYSLGTAWDVTTAIHDSYLDVSDQSFDISEVRFSPDGVRMYVMSGGTVDTIIQYTLNTPWLVSTATPTGTEVAYVAPFHVIPSLAIASQNLTQGNYYEISNKTTVGFHIVFRDSNGAPVERTFDYIAKGY